MRLREMRAAIKKISVFAESLHPDLEVCLHFKGRDWQKIGAHKMVASLCVGKNAYISPQERALYRALYKLTKNKADTWEKIASRLNRMRGYNT